MICKGPPSTAQEWGYSCRVVDLIKHMAKEDAKA